MRAEVKTLAEKLLVRSGLAGITRRINRRATVVLAYHNIVPDGETQCGERTLHLPQQMFAGQLDALQETHQIVSLRSLLEEDAASSLPRAIITFDDAYRGTVAAGIEELARRRLPATIFVAPGLLGGQALWWDEIAEPVTGVVRSEIRRRALESLAGDTPRIHDWVREQGIPVHRMPEHATTASLEELGASLRGADITLASHTWSHRNLTRLGIAALREELSRSLEWLRSRYPGILPLLAYPYGLSSPAVTAEAMKSYVGGLLIEGGLARRPVLERFPFRIPRLNVPAGISLQGFGLKTAGLWIH